MAIKVQQYEQQHREGALPGHRERGSDPRAGGLAKIAQGLEGVGKAAGDVADLANRVTYRQNMAAQHGSYSDLAGKRQEYVDLKLPQMLGHRALEEGDKIKEEFKKYGEEHIRNLGNDVQREAARRVFAEETNKLHRSVHQHQSKESLVLEEKKFEAAVKTAHSLVVGAALRGDEFDYEDAFSTGVAAVLSRGEAAGWSRDVIDLKRRTFVTSTHEAVLDSLLKSGESGRAAEYLAELKREDNAYAQRWVDKKALVDSGIEERVDNATFHDDAQDAAAQLFAVAKTTETATDEGVAVNSIWMMAELEKKRVEGNWSVKKYDETKKRFFNMMNDAARLERQDDAAPLAKLRELLFTGARPGMDHPLVLNLSQGGRTAWAGDLAKEAARVSKKRTDKRREDAEARRQQRERDRLYREIVNGMPSSGVDKGDKISADMELLGREIGASPWEIARAHGVQTKAKSDFDKDNGVSDSDFRATLERKLFQYIPEEANTKDDDVRRAAIKRYCNAAKSKWRHPKDPDLPPSEEEVKKWMDEWFINGEIPAPWWKNSENVLAVEAAMRGEKHVAFGPEDQPKSTLGAVVPMSVPEEDRQNIIKAYQAKNDGKMPSEATIRLWYSNKPGGGK